MGRMLMGHRDGHEWYWQAQPNWDLKHLLSKLSQPLGRLTLCDQEHIKMHVKATFNLEKLKKTDSALSNQINTLLMKLHRVFSLVRFIPVSI